jgi:uncharacterized membrane protein YhaH (DUF805 family)
MDWMLMPFRRFADFSGRSRRKEYWMFTLLNIIVGFVLGLIGGILGGSSEGGSVIGSAIIGLYVLAVIIPSIAVTVRRFHDQDKSGWFVLLAFIPFIGSLILLVFMCLEGTRGPNRFGDDPKAGG